MFLSTKEYGHEIGLSACFRQWRAESHCRLLHGYALAVKFTFGAQEVDVRNWVVDFGSMKSLKQMLQDTFDHTLLVAEDDPKLEVLKQLERMAWPCPCCGCPCCRLRDVCQHDFRVHGGLAEGQRLCTACQADCCGSERTRRKLGY